MTLVLVHLLSHVSDSLLILAITTLWADKPKPPGEGVVLLRSVRVIRAECGKEIDIWAIGCMVSNRVLLLFCKSPQSRIGFFFICSLDLQTYELLTGQILF